MTANRAPRTPVPAVGMPCLRCRAGRTEVGRFAASVHWLSKRSADRTRLPVDIIRSVRVNSIQEHELRIVSM